MSQSERVSEQLKIFFAERGYTQRKIAEIIGVSQQVVQTLLNGRAFGKKTAGVWSEHFGFNPAWLITGEGAMMLADKESESKQQTAAEITANTAVSEISQSIANEILQLIADGELYTKKTIEQKDEIIRKKDDEIQKLNREIGALQAQLEQLKQQHPAELKKAAV